MVKVKRFDGSLFHPDPQKSMEKFINENGIVKSQIISAVPTSNSFGRSMSLSMVLTYDDKR